MHHSIRWTGQKIEQRLKLISELVYRRRLILPSFRYCALSGPRDLPPIDSSVDDSSWPVVEPLTYWGQPRTDFVLRSSFQVPQDWEKDFPFALYLPEGTVGEFVHPEALIYIDGRSYATCDRFHHEVSLRAAWHDGRSHLLALHGWTGLGEPVDQQLLRACELVQIDQPTRAFIATARVALGVAMALNEDVPARGRLLFALNQAFRILDTREPFGDSFYASVADAHATLNEGIAQAGVPLDAEVVGTGHAHIDVAWLWTLDQVRNKAARTFHTVCHLMEQFPDYHFTQSQPQLYSYIRQDHPELFELIKQRVAEGRWEATGGMWVEADCNLSGPESLARQFLLGRSFFAEHFGADADTPVLWLPDVFGYAWALPQLIKQAGLEYFFTIKIGWSQYNRLPYDSFWWEGIDGTRVLTHFSPTPDAGRTAYASTYKSMATPEDVLATWTNFRQKDLGHGKVTPPLLLAFGHGDGGGGPTPEMLENLHELRSFPAAPRVSQEHVSDFFRRLEETAGPMLPTWNGELYLEYHRGTYTTQGRNKRANRKSEFLLHDAEFLATQASLLDSTYVYPHTHARTAWELVCLNQFHDIIPGTSISEVYKQSQQQYAHVREISLGMREAALELITRSIPGDVFIVNPTSFVANDVVSWADQLPDGMHLQNTVTGEPICTQSGVAGTLIDAGTIEPFSVIGYTLVPGPVRSPQTSLLVTLHSLENVLLRVQLNQAGDIISLYDKVRQREILPAGAVANQFQAFEDRPLQWDAWDIDIFYDDKMWYADPASSIRVIEQGPLRATLEIKRHVLHSSYTQYISLNHNSCRLDINTTIDWCERHILLKAAFPVDILNPVATYEIQWGNVQRPTHRNTSWDWARFETCAQKWVDLSEGDYGVSLLNDCKYGHDIRDNVIRISLLRSPTLPDPEADQGQHQFSYSLLPHTGSWGTETIRSAYLLNDPLIVYRARPDRVMPEPYILAPLVALDKENVVVETIKRAEDGNGLIVRLYESQRRRCSVTLSTSFSLQAVWRTNLLEKNQAVLAVESNQVTFPIKPYEIVTLRLLTL